MSLAQNFAPPAPATLLAAAPQRLLLHAANGHETSSAGAAVAIEEPAIEPPVIAPSIIEPVPQEPEAAKSLAPLDNLVIRPARSNGRTPAVSSPAPLAVRLSPPVVAGTTATAQAEFALDSAGPVPTGAVRFRASRGHQSATLRPGPEPLPSRRQSIAFVRKRCNGVSGSALAMGACLPLPPPLPNLNGHWKQSASLQLAYRSGSPALPACGLSLAGASLAELRRALELSIQEIEEASIAAIYDSFSEQPVTPLLSAPAEIVAPPAPPAEQWLRSQKPKFTPVAPDSAGRAAVIAGPQTPTLAGPTLPRQLRQFDHQPSGLRPRNKRWPAWPLSLLFMTVVILAVVSALQYFAGDRDTRTASAAPPPQYAKSAPARLPVLQEHPSARSVEVAGIRIVNSPGKRPQVHFIVINHAPTELTGLNIRIAVRSADSSGDAPLFTISSPVSSLGPNQSKEVHADVSASIPASEIPDWQSLRTDVTVGRQ